MYLFGIKYKPSISPPNGRPCTTKPQPSPYFHSSCFTTLFTLCFVHSTLLFGYISPVTITADWNAKSRAEYGQCFNQYCFCSALSSLGFHPKKPNRVASCPLFFGLHIIFLTLFVSLNSYLVDIYFLIWIFSTKTSLLRGNVLWLKSSRIHISCSSCFILESANQFSLDWCNIFEIQDLLKPQIRV